MEYLVLITLVVENRADHRCISANNNITRMSNKNKCFESRLYSFPMKPNRASISTIFVVYMINKGRESK